MSRLEVFFGLGALLMPALASVLIVRGVWYVAFPLIAAVSIVTALLWMRMSFGPLDRPLGKPMPKEGAAVRRPDRHSITLLGMMTTFFLLYVGIEMSLVNFAPSVLIDVTGAAPAVAATAITVFWAAMSLGRLFAGVAAERTGYARYLLASCCGTLALLVAFAFIFRLGGGFLVIALLGLAMSGIFSIGLVYANALIAGPTEHTTSLLVAAGGIGGALVPRVVGWTMDAYAAGATRWLLAVLTLFMLLIMLATSVLGRAQRAGLAGESGERLPAKRAETGGK